MQLVSLIEYAPHFCCQDKRESRAMLSLGNFYFARALLAKGGSDAAGAAQFLKDSYKFFHHVLAQDMTNAYGKYACLCDTYICIHTYTHSFKYYN